MTIQTSTPTTTSPTTNQTPVTRWALDASHSSLTFSVRHLMISNVRGEFQQLAGTLNLDPQKLSDARLEVEIDLASVNTREPKRDEHLRSADFFDVANHPKAIFTSRVFKTNGPDSYSVLGDLTLHGVTRPLTLEVTGVTAQHVDPWGNRRIGGSATAVVKRSDFGMTWNSALEAGGVLVGDEIKLVIDAELVEAKEGATA